MAVAAVEGREDVVVVLDQLKSRRRSDAAREKRLRSIAMLLLEYATAKKASGVAAAIVSSCLRQRCGSDRG